MKKPYDLLVEPWIPVVDFNGHRSFLGIRDVLNQAHTLREISDASPLVEYGLYRLLCVFLMDAVRPQSIIDIEDVLEAGSFDADSIDNYIQQCKAEGATFDLFDDKKPFLQAAPDSAYDGEKRTASYLDYTVPTGNSHTHFDHLGKDPAVTFPEAAKKLIPCYLFATAGVQGFPSSVNAAPPFLTVLKGKNLFETLTNTLMPIEEIHIPFDKPPVFWRGDGRVEPKKKIAKTSWLYAMLFPARRIRLIPDWESQTVSEVLFSQGMDFCEPGNWTDPHVTYRVNEKGRFPWRPNAAKAVWRNLSDLIDVKGKHAPKCLQNYQELHTSGVSIVNISLYGVQTSQASYLQLAYYDFQVPTAVMSEAERIDCIRICIERAEKLAFYLGLATKHKQIPAEQSTRCIQLYYEDCEKALWSLCAGQLSQKPFDADATSRVWAEALYSAASRQLQSFLNSLSLPTEAWIEVYKQQQGLNNQLRELLKEVNEHE